jgi:hypothetical protein
MMVSGRFLKKLGLVISARNRGPKKYASYREDVEFHDE